MNTCPFCKKDFELDFDEDYDNCWNELEWEKDY